DTDALAVVPDGVDLATAAALPMAGLTALRSLRASGAGPGSRVLVTGASGAVGRLAVQLAARAGAYVIASVSTPERTGRVPHGGTATRSAHAARVDSGRAARHESAASRGGRVEVVVGVEKAGPVDVVIDVVGGPVLVAAWGLLKPGGNLQSVGWAAGKAAVFPPDSTFALGEARTLSSFGDVASPAADLAHLLSLVAAGELDVEVGWRGPWERLGEAAAAQLDREITGKVVLDVTHRRA
ncbi:hypothetical protein E1286_33030, partial [Nonomuraea terrae]